MLGFRKQNLKNKYRRISDETTRQEEILKQELAEHVAKKVESIRNSLSVLKDLTQYATNLMFQEPNKGSLADIAKHAKNAEELDDTFWSAYQTVEKFENGNATVSELSDAVIALTMMTNVMLISMVALRRM